MFIIYKIEEYNPGHFIYDDNSLIGIYDNMDIAKNCLINHVLKNIYGNYEIKKNICDYFLIFTDMYSDEEGKICYEIIKKDIIINGELLNICSQ